MKLYRITKLSTGSLQPSDSATFWGRELLYCGYDREEARMVYHSHTSEEVWQGYGNKVVEIESVTISDANDDFSDDEIDKVVEAD